MKMCVVCGETIPGVSDDSEVNACDDCAGQEARSVDAECPGHEVIDRGAIGSVEFCDGSCRRVRRVFKPDPARELRELQDAVAEWRVKVQNLEAQVVVDLEALELAATAIDSLARNYPGNMTTWLLEARQKAKDAISRAQAAAVAPRAAPEPQASPVAPVPAQGPSPRPWDLLDPTLRAARDVQRRGRS